MRLDGIAKLISFSLSTFIAAIVFPALFTFYTGVTSTPVRLHDYHPDSRLPVGRLTLVQSCAAAPSSVPQLQPLDNASLLDRGETVRLQLALAPDGVIEEVRLIEDLSSFVAQRIVDEARMLWRFEPAQRGRWIMQCGYIRGRTIVITVKSPRQPLLL